ncbi:ABC transporter permease family protein [Portibacter lacus]|uniref:Uncharacterized protein n=1 Tax=Portibacter lacus TaxID=1099794 RepID=A0AA37WDB1_9BACT|nr:hypothetical protein [Portibacter lacus]GLR16663.1 hypothetical protein GCM10007940_12780 [Portibacter lacus]
MMKKIVSILLNIKGDFQNLFIFNEYEELTGKSKSGIITLSVILGITFLALGYAIGGINYLKEKMDDPFTNWVNLEIKQSYRDKVTNVQLEMERDSMKSKFMLNNIGQYNIEFLPFVNYMNGEEYNIRLRTLDLEDNLLGEILSSSKGNVVSGYSYNGDGPIDIEQCGIIIKESSLRSLGYEDVESVRRIPIKVENFVVYPEITAVVKELPNLVDFVITPHFYTLLIESFETTNFINISSSNKIEVISPETDKKKLEDDVRKSLKNFSVASTDTREIELVDGEISTIVTLYFNDYFRYSVKDTIVSELKQNSSYVYNRFSPWECNVGTLYNIDDPYYLSFNFDQLDKVRDFKNHMWDRYEVEISMDQVEQKENFALVSNLTNFISLILFGFSILSIVFYVNSLLRTHLEKIKMNLGTLKAFGLNNNFLISSYLKIILTFIGISIAIAYVICGIWDLLESRLFSTSYFDVFNYKILIAIIVIIITALITSQRTISKTLLKTPGDLIYNR